MQQTVDHRGELTRIPSNGINVPLSPLCLFHPLPLFWLRARFRSSAVNRFTSEYLDTAVDRCSAEEERPRPIPVTTISIRLPGLPPAIGYLKQGPGIINTREGKRKKRKKWNIDGRKKRRDQPRLESLLLNDKTQGTLLSKSHLTRHLKRFKNNKAITRIIYLCIFATSIPPSPSFVSGDVFFSLFLSFLHSSLDLCRVARVLCIFLCPVRFASPAVIFNNVRTRVHRTVHPRKHRPEYQNFYSSRNGKPMNLARCFGAVSPWECDERSEI